MSRGCGNGLRVGGYRLHALDQPVRSGSAPVTGEQRPSHNLQIELASGGGQPWIAPAERRPEEFWRRSESGGDGVVAAMNFVAGLRRGTPEKIGMRIGVVADGVAAGCGFAKEFGMLADVLADDEKRRMRFVAIEELKEFRSDGGIRSVVEGDSKFPRRICMRDCGAEDS